MKKVFTKKDIAKNIVCKYLKNRKYIIIEKDFKYKKRIIDLIIYDDIEKELVFVNLKICYTIEEFNIRNRFRQKDIYRNLAKAYNHDYGLYDIPVRFDMIKIFLNNSMYKIKHKKRIFI